MKNFILLFRRFLAVSYKRYVVANILCNLISTVFSLFSFGTIIPILQILFGMQTASHSHIEWSMADGIRQVIEAFTNNIAWYVEQIIATYGGETTLLLLGAFLLVTATLKAGFQFLAGYYMTPIQTGVLRDIRKQLYDKIISLPLGFYSEERKGDIMARLTGDVGEIGNSIMQSVDTMFKNPLMIVIYFFVLLTISWQLTIFVLILLPVGGFIVAKIGKTLRHRSLLGQTQTGELLSQIEETLSGLRIIKAFNAENKVSLRFANLNETVRKTFNRINRKFILAHPVTELLGTAIIVIVLCYGGSLILANEGNITAPSFIYYLVIFYSIIAPVKDISRAGFTIQKGMASLQRVDVILDADDRIYDADDAHPIQDFKDKISFENLYFKYKDNWVLQNICMEVKKGEMVALVGQSGSGKSTMVDLLPRFYDVQQGSIKIDGTDVRNLRLHDLRALMGNVNQEAILFNDTFFNNIAFGVKKATKEEVVAAAKIANAHEFIMATPQGYDSNIGDRGGKLSGGQRQRISIARAILKNPAILILDEATSALDTESEKLVQDAIDRLMQNRTSIVIAHRLSTIRKANMIYVMNEGQIVERGQHEELIALNGYYKRLCDMQSF